MRRDLIFYTIMFFVLTIGCTEKKQNSQKETENSLASLPKGSLPEGPLLLPADSNPEAKKHNEEGISHYKEGHYDIALNHFQEAEKLDPAIGEIHFNEALAQDKMGKHGEATNHFKTARENAKGNEKILKSEILIKHIQ